MINLYGKSYAKDNRELVSSLFNSGGTANGVYKKTNKGIFLHHHSGDRSVFIRADGLGPVSCHKVEGRWRYMNSCTIADAEWINKPASYADSCNQAREFAASVFS